MYTPAAAYNRFRSLLKKRNTTCNFFGKLRVTKNLYSLLAEMHGSGIFAAVLAA
jgi:hypothetical protein